MKTIFSKLSGKVVMMLCIAACALPFVLIMVIGGQANLSWLGLMACVVMHLVMMKMMPHDKSCHRKQASEKADGLNQPQDTVKKPTTSVDA